jgi:hypothetical protein
VGVVYSAPFIPLEVTISFVKESVMIDFTNRDLFTPVTHPESGVVIYVLTRRVAPLQQGFYFVNDSMSADGRYLWFYCAFPPSLGRTLGVVDFQTGEVRHYPETQFGGPYVAPETGFAYWMHGKTLWRRGPQADAEVEQLNEIPSELIGSRSAGSPTHLTRSADGKSFFIDMSVGLQYIYGSLPIDGSDFELWHRMDRNYNHAQFSPTDPDVALIAQEFHSDQITGLRLPITNRLWLLHKGEKPRPILREPKWVTHEWWDPDGEHVWCVWGNDTWRVRVSDGEVELIPFPRHCWHSHSSHNGRLIVGDSNNGFYRGCASLVHFLNRDTNKVITLAEHAERHDYSGRNYHIDPHPRFVAQDRYVVFTTTVLGKIDVALVPVSSLLEHTQ